MSNISSAKRSSSNSKGFITEGWTVFPTNIQTLGSNDSLQEGREMELFPYIKLDAMELGVGCHSMKKFSIGSNYEVKSDNMPLDDVSYDVQPRSDCKI